MLFQCMCMTAAQLPYLPLALPSFTPSAPLIARPPVPAAPAFVPLRTAGTVVAATTTACQRSPVPTACLAVPAQAQPTAACWPSAALGRDAFPISATTAGLCVLDPASRGTTSMPAQPTAQPVSPACQATGVLLQPPAIPHQTPSPATLAAIKTRLARLTARSVLAALPRQTSQQTRATHLFATAFKAHAWSACLSPSLTGRALSQRTPAHR